MKDIDELEKENKKLKNELNKLKSLQKVVDSLKMSRREQLGNLDTESMSLDYLRPYDFEDQRDSDEMDDNEGISLKNNTTRLRGQRRSKNLKEDDDEYQKKKSEQGARALMRIRRAQERKRKQEEEDAEKYALHKSAKITKIANELEETLKHRREEDEQKEKEKENNKDDYEEENTPIFSVAGSKRKRGNQYNY